MINLGIDREKSLHEIVSIVKLSSLLFSAIPFLIYFYDEFNSNPSLIVTYYNLIWVMTVLFIISGVYFLWTLSTIKKFNKKTIQHIQNAENIFFVVIFFAAIMASGGYQSKYKILFLFIIITSTIQSGMKKGIIFACISSILILGMDLISYKGNGANLFFQNDLTLAGLFILTAWPLGYYVKIEGEHIKQLEDLVNEDGLTGVYNHRFFHDALKEKISLSEKEKKPVSLIFLDIDYFKHYNDLYGHQKGDAVLKKVGEVLKINARSGDIVARYGGEEFAILMPNTDETEAAKAAEKIRQKIEEEDFDGEENQPGGKITASVGLSIYPDKAKNDLELLKSADDALYRAKFFNKNRVEIYTSILDELRENMHMDEEELIGSVKTLISVINSKDKYTYGHVERVGVYARMLADRLKLSDAERDTIVCGAYMHDIGKINIPKEILNKKMPLTNEEWELMKQHPENGVDVIKTVKSLENVLPLVLHHHERYDGNGYPSGLKGEEIPYLARVLTVVDSFDAMISNRPYSTRKTYEEACEEIIKCKSIQFDPKIADIFVELIRENNEVFM